MTNPAPTSDDYRLDQLLRYFGAQQTIPRKPILHPDQNINRLINSTELAADSFRNAAVLIPVLTARTGSAILLTLRTEHLSSHPGQVSFPGGTADKSDASPVHTALRESEEEIGLKPEAVRIIGQLGNLLMPSGYCVSPVVGVVEATTPLTPSPEEVALIFTVPLNVALDPDAYQRVQVPYHQDTVRETLEMHHEGYRIWGATAAILHHLAMELAALR